MERSPRGVPGEPRVVDGLEDNSLSSERGVAVHHKWKICAAITIWKPILKSARDPLNDGVNELKVRWIWNNLHVDIGSIRRALRYKSEVVLYIASPRDRGDRLVFKL